MHRTPCLYALTLILCVIASTFSQKCKDERDGCERFKGSNLCEIFKTSLLNVCTRTCGWCQELNQPNLEETCVDTFPACENVVQYCTPRYRDFLEKQCKKTCKWCPAGQDHSEPKWNVLSDCSKSCGRGIRYRVPRCPLNDINRCPKVYEECNRGACPKAVCKSDERHRHMDTTSCCKIPTHNRCGVPQHIPSASRVIGGRRADLQLWSWMVRIEIDFRKGETGLCGGSLIDAKWVVTAGHCVQGIRFHQFKVYVGYGTPKQQEVGIVSKHIQVNYDFPMADIALIELKSRVKYNTYIQPLCLPRGEVSAPEITCFAAGWGLTETGNPSDHLLEVDLHKLPLGVCKEAYKDDPFASHIDSRMICAGRLSGGVDTCLGDSGGPLMCQRCSSCEWYLAGITSFGPEQCGKAGQPGMYVNVVSYEGWILRFTKATQKRTFSCRGYSSN